MNKTFLLFLLLIPSYVYSNTTQESPCEKEIRNAYSSCESTLKQCASLNECLVRRDTCVESVPKNEMECNNIKTCMQDYKEKFNSKFSDNYTKCNYKWNESNNGSCSLEEVVFIEACPGRVRLLLNLFAYGPSATADLDFNCESVNVKYQKKQKFCKKSIQDAKNVCNMNIPEELKKLAETKCEYSIKFASYTGAQFSLNNSTSTRVHQGPRNSPDYNRPPHGDEGGGGTGGGAGSAQ